MEWSLQTMGGLRHHLAEQGDWVAALDGFEEHFRATNVFAVDVPGRICVLGDHSDYVPYVNANIVTFASSEQRMRALIAPRNDRLVRIGSSLEGCEYTEFSLDEDVMERDSDWLTELDSRENVVPHWSNYVRGAVAYMMHFQNLDFGFDMFLHSTIPSASGTSSSSALTLCGLVATHLSNELPWDEKELARMGGEAEWYVGTRGGAMDHATMMCAESNSMVLLKFENGSFSTEQISIGKTGCNWYTVFTHPADKGGAMMSAFNELAFVQQSVLSEILEEVGFENDEVWRDVSNSLPDVIEVSGFGCIRVRDRFRFVMRERLRAMRFVEALRSGDRIVISQLLEESWNDTRELLGTHTPEMDRVGDALYEIDGVLGVKVLGAGFGGNLLVYAEEGVDLGVRFTMHTPGCGLRLIECQPE
jgi:galactokinase